jgi:hypothetical protein
MAYSDFTIADVKSRLGLTLDEGADLFGSVPPRPVSPRLVERLAEHAPLAGDISTEKARSEFVVAPILLKVRRLLRPRASLFSGSDFPVEPSLGLFGRCDFLICRSPEQLSIEAPSAVVVEAKTEDMRAGYPQCAAGMVACRTFNHRRGKPLAEISGAVTTGSVWRFLRLRGDLLEIEGIERHITDLGRIIGILCRMVEGGPSPAAGRHAPAGEAA